MNDAYKPVNQKTLADVNKINSATHQPSSSSSESVKDADALISHPPLIKEMVEGAKLHDAAFEQAKQQLESSGHVQSGTHRSGATIYKHPKEKGSVLLHPDGNVSSGEFGS